MYNDYLPMKMEQTVCSETSAYKIQTPENYPDENIEQHGRVFASSELVLRHEMQVFFVINYISNPVTSPAVSQRLVEV